MIMICLCECAFSASLIIPTAFNYRLSHTIVELENNGFMILLETDIFENNFLNAWCWLHLLHSDTDRRPYPNDRVWKGKHRSMTLTGRATVGRTSLHSAVDLSQVRSHGCNCSGVTWSTSWHTADIAAE